MPQRQHLLIVSGAVALLGMAMVYPWLNSQSKPVVSLNVASSLHPVIKRQVNRLDQSLPGRPVISSAGSQTVARQIANGKEADIVFLANVDWMDYLAENGAIQPGTRRALLSNRLVLIGPDADTSVESIEALRRESIQLGLGNVDAVPAGIYARTTLESMGLWNNRPFETVMFPHVRAVLSAVSSGELAAGIVYQSDLRREQDVRRIATFPETPVPPIEYPIALAEGASKLSRRWYRALVRPDARETYRDNGFDVIEP